MSAPRSGGFAGLMPLVDTLFLLLFALLAVSETKAAETEEVHVSLPEVSSEESAPAAPTLRVQIEVDAESSVRVAGGEALASVDDVERAIVGEIGDALPDQVAVEIRADQASRYGVTVQLLQHLRLSGFVDVRLTALGGGDGSLGGEQ